MRDVNLKHLHYFWAVAHQGSIAAASEHLFVTPQTISAQLKELESHIGHQLLRRSGRGLTLTPAGETALRYADRIFDLKRELVASLASDSNQPPQLQIGISDVVPKLIASQLLVSVISAQPAPRLVCTEAETGELLARLAQHKLDLVISDRSAPPDPNLRLYNHKLGSTGISFMAAQGLIRKAGVPFPACIDGAPLLMPGRHTALRMTLEAWLREQGINVFIAGEFDDSALIKACGQLGAGIFCCPSAIAAEVSRAFSVQEIGRTTEIKESYFLISPNKRITQPLVLKILDCARTQLFQS